ncbi:unnamed protein product, partial [Mesorhabditis spiculigera]
MCASSIFVLVVMKGSKDAFKFIQFLAVIDLLSGLTMVYAGFHGVIRTIYGAAGEFVPPISCMYSSWHLPLWVFTDGLQSTMLIWFTLDRLLLVLIPVRYAKVASLYLHKRFVNVAVVASLGYLYPIFKEVPATINNASAVISSLCHLEEVVGAENYTLHVLLFQFVPIGCVLVCFLALLIYMVRHLKQRWSYNWSEPAEVTRQLLLVLSTRAFLFGVSVHLPLLFTQKNAAADDLLILRDFFIRICLGLCVSIASPLLLISLCPQFSHNVYMLFNKYSHNTKRQWQSASDPPREEGDGDNNSEPGGKEDYADAVVNMFGSFYSTGGGPMGDVGTITHLDRANNERSISFYYQESPKSTASKKHQNL